MIRFPQPEQITPEEFELMVKKWFESCSDSLTEFEVKHLDSIEGVDGEFVFDVTARFTALGGAEFLVVCECKKHKHPIKRDVVQVLNDKKRSVGANKGFVIATAPFQSGAKEYAKTHGIALCQIVSGNIAYIQANASGQFPEIPDNADPFVAVFPCKMAGGTILDVALISSTSTYWLEEFLKFPPGQEYQSSTESRGKNAK